MYSVNPDSQKFILKATLQQAHSDNKSADFTSFLLKKNLSSSSSWMFAFKRGPCFIPLAKTLTPLAALNMPNILNE